jgi:hypothetical protein
VGEHVEIPKVNLSYAKHTEDHALRRKFDLDQVGIPTGADGEMAARTGARAGTQVSLLPSRS